MQRRRVWEQRGCEHTGEDVASDRPVAYRCSTCGNCTTPRRERCPRCRGTGFVEVELSEGRVLTHTTLTATRPGFSKPLILAIVDFGDGVRALGQFDGAEPRIGLRVKPTSGKLGERDGVAIIGLKFVPL